MCAGPKAVFNVAATIAIQRFALATVRGICCWSARCKCKIKNARLKLPIKLKGNGQSRTKAAILLMLKLQCPAPYFANAVLYADFVLGG